MEIHVCRRGDVTLNLVAWLYGRPVGHTEMRQTGCAAPEVTVGCPEIGGLGVRPEELRSRGIGTELVRAAEELARGRDLDVVGIGVGRDNHRAAALYARLGYPGHLDVKLA